jgi:hypothetical protein
VGFRQITMTGLVRGVAEERKTLYVVIDEHLYEISKPEEGRVERTKLSPKAVAFLMLGKRVKVKIGGNRIKLVCSGIEGEIVADEIDYIDIVRVEAPSLLIAAWAAREFVPGVPYYDVVDRRPELAVPAWVGFNEICKLPLFKCKRGAAK